MTRSLCRLALLASLSIPFHTALADDDDHRQPPPPAVYVEECGSCHVPYPARGLPAAAWQTMMGSLDAHFDSDASLEPPLEQQILAYLTTHAGRASREAGAGEPSLRITRARWFLHEHDEVPASVWRSPAVKSASNCGACHREATDGRYSEHDVRIPAASSPRTTKGDSR